MYKVSHIDLSNKNVFKQPLISPVTMEVPGSLYVECPKCGEETLHQVLKGKTGKGKTLSATLQCDQCGNVKKEVIRPEKKQKLRLIVSHRENSIRDTAEFHPDDVLRIGDIFLYDDYDVRITGIETQKARVGRAKASNIITLWVTRFDFVDVGISIKQGENTRSFKIQVDPNDEFSVGEDMLIQGEKFIIDKIKIPMMTVKRPTRGAFAYDIKRIYLKKPPQKKKYNRGRGQRKR